VADGTAVRSPEIVMSSILGAPFMIRLLAMLDGAARRRDHLRVVASVSVSAVLPGLALGWNAGLAGPGVLIVATQMPQLTSSFERPTPLAC
jgi:hypothetical protein